MSYISKSMNHLGIVSGIFDLLQIQEVIDTELPSEQRNVSHGEAVKAMVLNALGFTSRALYLTGEFFKTKPIELIREGLNPEELNDDSLGRSLDRLHQAGVTELFSKVVTRAMDVLQRETTIAHLDSTTFSLWSLSY